MNSRFPLYLALIALPVLAFCALGVYFLVDKAPRLINAEKASVTRDYRELAETLVTNAAAATWRGERERGWRQVSKIDRRFPWGVVERGGGRVLIWVEPDEKPAGGGRDGKSAGSAKKGALIGIEREASPDRTAFWIYGGFVFAMAFVIVVATSGVVLMLRYNRERESFLAGMIHDLNNPLVAIRGLVKSDPEYVAGIVTSMLRMIRNAQDSLGLGRRRGLEITRFDLIPLILESYKLFEEHFTEDEAGAVRFDMPGSLEVEADATEVRQVLWNLFSNAAKYAASYGPVAVSVRGATGPGQSRCDPGSGQSRGGFAAVEIADRGIGMTPRQMRRAFDRFYRAGGLHECGKGGFGIGLHTSRISARRMGGDLTVRANSPRGCIFTLSLKLPESER